MPLNVNRRATLALAVIALSSAACDRKKPPADKIRTAKTVAAVDAGPKPLRGKPLTAKELATTDESIWLENLDGQISELERLLAERPRFAPNVQKLSAAFQVRGRFRGDVEEQQRAIDLATKCIELDPEAGACFLMRADQEQSLHRFAAARTDLEHASKLGGDAARIVDLEADLDWNDGKYERAIEAIRKARRDRPSASSVLREAQLEHDLGEYERADRAFEEAEDKLADTAPLPVAHLNVQRGVHETERGDLERAVVFFREAVARMPSYVAAKEHLAETLHDLGRDEEATKIYESVVDQSNDPEFSHALAELYAAHGKKNEARALEAKAKHRYEELLVKFPEAMYWHASEFFHDIGDDKKSLELLRKNVALRPNGTSFVALARAELENGHVPEAKAAIDKALAMPLRSASLFATAATVYARVGERARADELRASARKLNPRVATDLR